MGLLAKTFTLVPVAALLLGMWTSAHAKLPDPSQKPPVRSASGGIDRGRVNAPFDLGPLSSLRRPYGHRAYDPRLSQDYLGFSSTYPTNYYPASGAYRSAPTLGKVISGAWELFTSAEGSFTGNLWTFTRDSILAPLGERYLYVGSSRLLGQTDIGQALSRQDRLLDVLNDPAFWIRYCSALSNPFSRNNHYLDPRIFRFYQNTR